MCGISDGKIMVIDEQCVIGRARLSHFYLKAHMLT